MKKRAKILRDTTLGPGLLMMEGQQYRFSSDVWKSQAPPRPGLVVDVDLGPQGEVQSVSVVSDALLARELATGAASAAPRNRLPSASPQTSRIPIQLAAAALLATTWFFLPAASIQVPFPGKLGFTFWQILGLQNSGSMPDLLDNRSGPDAGLYGVLAIVLLAAPFLSHFWKSRIALLSGLLPLIFVIAIAVAFHRRVENMQTVSLDIGTYLSILIGLFLAFASLKTFRAAKPKDAQHPESPQRKAA